MTAITPPGRLGLSRERILDQAAELIDSAGPGSFSMRKLADRLDVSAMALYRWFASKDDLLDALTERAVDHVAVVVDPERSGPWLDRALGYAHAIRRNLLEHLPLLQLDGASRRLTSNVVRNADHGLGLMMELGYRDAAAVDAYRVLFWSIVNYCLVIDATNPLPTVADSNAVIERVIEADGDDLADRLPTLAALLPHFTQVDPDEFFERSIRTVLAGLRVSAGGQDGSRT